MTETITFACDLRTPEEEANRRAERALIIRGAAQMIRARANEIMAENRKAREEQAKLEAIGDKIGKFLGASIVSGLVCWFLFGVLL